MREIKFRAWNIYKNKMHEWPLEGFDRGQLIRLLSNDYTGELTIMQYSGLKDANGTEIFEDDIVQDEEGDTFKVYWNKQQAQFLCDLIGAEGIGIYDEFSIDDTAGLVIGNVWNNPELLK